MKNEKIVTELLLSFSAIFGIITGIGFLFAGYLESIFILVVFGFVLIVVGLFASVFLKNE